MNIRVFLVGGVVNRGEGGFVLFEAKVTACLVNEDPKGGFRFYLPRDPDVPVFSVAVTEPVVPCRPATASCL